MVRRAALAAAAALPVAFGAGWLAGGPGAAASAALAVAVVAGNFAAHGLSLAWAAGVSVGAVQAVALGGFVLRMGVILGALFALDRAAFFSPLVFGLTAMAATVALLVYEARLVAAGLGGSLDLPPDPAATAAARKLRLSEEGP
ncbi:MAG TPA: hypothetical protein VHL78_06660 [Actinomycetota bacterium]|nr:hypothetical protein [Actinomycetota bacterium]